LSVLLRAFQSCLSRRQNGGIRANDVALQGTKRIVQLNIIRTPHICCWISYESGGSSPKIIRGKPAMSILPFKIPLNTQFCLAFVSGWVKFLLPFQMIISASICLLFLNYKMHRTATEPVISRSEFRVHTLWQFPLPLDRFVF
jgi:hypothetical protein